MKASIVLVSFLGLVSGMVLPGHRVSPSGAKPQPRSLFRREANLDYRYTPGAQVCCFVMIPKRYNELELTQAFREPGMPRHSHHVPSFVRLLLGNEVRERRWRVGLHSQRLNQSERISYDDRIGWSHWWLLRSRGFPACLAWPGATAVSQPGLGLGLGLGLSHILSLFIF